MEYETKYGKVSLKVNLDGSVEVTSDIPFKKVSETYTELKEAINRFNELKKEIDKIISEMERKKAEVTTEKISLFNELYNLIKNFRVILLYGITGTGKTTTAREVCKKLLEEGLIDDWIQITLSSGMDDYDLLGKFIPKSKGKLEYTESKLVEYLKKAKDERVVIILDEFNRVHSKALNILIQLLDVKDNKIILNNYITNEIIEVPAENVKFILTANFGSAYHGTYQVDEAIMNRIDIALNVYYDEHLENSIIAQLPDKKAEFVKELTRYLRELQKDGIIRPFTTRDLLNTVKIIDTVNELNEAELKSKLKPIIHKIVRSDHMGNIDEDTINDIYGFIGKYIKGE